MKHWAIADIHGCYNTLRRLLEEILEIDKTDYLYLLGDIVDRGCQVKKTLDYIISLQEKGFNIMPIKGNHEYFLLNAYYLEKTQQVSKYRFGKCKEKRYIKNWLQTGGANTLKSFEIDNAGQIPEFYINWIEKLPLYYETDKVILTHAGLNYKEANPFDDHKSMLFGENNYFDNNNLHQKIVVHGHNITSLEAINEMLKNIDKHRFLCIDNGCVFINNNNNYGHLIALDLENMTIQTQLNIDYY